MTGRDRQIFEAYVEDDDASYKTLAAAFGISRSLVIAAVGRVRTWQQHYRAARLAAGLILGGVLLVGCGSPFGEGHPGDDAGELAEAQGADAPGRDAGGGSDAAEAEAVDGTDAPAMGEDAGETSTVDAGAEDAEGDAGCSPPSFATFTCGGTLIPVPSVVCGYKESTYTYEPLPTPKGCECAATYDCACIAPMVGALCPGGWCVDTGSSPPVPRVYCP